MLHRSTQLFAKALGALDGIVGEIRDIYFHDQTWNVRYVVANTGTWLAERLVLLSPKTFLRPPFGELHGIRDVLRVNLTRSQVENSPAIDTHPTVSRQHSFDYRPYHGWAAIWADGGTWGVAGYPIVAPRADGAHDSSAMLEETDDLHLRSARTLAGYRLHSIDRTFGHVRAFTVDDTTWTIRDLVIEAGHWYASRTLSIPACRVRSFNYQESSVYVDLTQREILDPTATPGCETHATLPQ